MFNFIMLQILMKKPVTAIKEPPDSQYFCQWRVNHENFRSRGHKLSLKSRWNLKDCLSNS